MSSYIGAQPSRGGYESGVCNIGPAEIAYRRRWGHLGLAVTMVLFVALIWTGPPYWTRILLALPAAASAVGYLQAYLRFCAAFGALGVFNFGARRDVTRVSDEVAHKRDRLRALQIFGASGLIGLAVGVLAVLLPW
ncbi:MAG: hypothetical protein ABI452_05540 [Candidatus Limnocylindrales bacterium]